MILINSILSNRVSLVNLINNSLTKSIIRTHQRCGVLGNTAQEPDFVADLTLNWTQELHTILKLILNPKLQIGIASVYCHQKPLVDFGHSKNPELGDILFVFKYTDLYGKTIHNSLLLQAKKTSKQDFRIPKTELHQLELYMNWPKFKYLRANTLNGKTRDIHPKCVTQGAKYLLIDPDPFMILGINETFAFGCAIPNNFISISSDFTNEIINFLTFETGRTISDEKSVTEDWSKMIWDLLSITKNKMTRRKNAGLSRFPRKTSINFDGCCFINTENYNSYYSDIRNEFNESGGDNYIDNNDNYRIDDNGGGVSTIMIEINENE